MRAILWQQKEQWEVLATVLTEQLRTNTPSLSLLLRLACKLTPAPVVKLFAFLEQIRFEYKYINRALENDEASPMC